MADLIPEDSISLRAAYARFSTELWEGHSPVAELNEKVAYTGCPAQAVERSQASLANVSDSMLREFRNAFSNGYLNALVRPPDAPENFSIPEESWVSTFFAERTFLSETIVQGHGGYWEGLVGRTPFVRRSEFDPWLSAKINRKRHAGTIPSPAIQALRSHLVGLAANGLLSSVEVEDLAAQWGLEPFATTPSDAAHDPMSLSHWTLAMAATWLVWRDKSCVRKTMDAYRLNSCEWKSFGRGFLDGEVPYKVFGEEPRTPSPLSLSKLCGIEAAGFDLWEKPMLMSLKSARQTLWRHLGEGTLVAGAVDAAGDLVQVRSHQWAGLVLAETGTGDDYLCFEHNLLKPIYTRISLTRRAILAEWPEPASTLGEPPVELRQLKTRRNGKLLATIAALMVRYPTGLPIGLTAKNRLNSVNNWLVENDRSPVSNTTILRALAQMTAPTRTK